MFEDRESFLAATVLVRMQSEVKSSLYELQG